MTTKSSKDKGKGKGKGAGDLAFSELRFLNGPRPRAESGSDEDGTQNESESQDRHESVEGSVQDRTSKFFKSDTAKSRKKLGGGPSGRVHQGSASCGSHKSNESTARKRKGSRRQSTRKSEVKSREARASSTYDDASSHSSDDQAHSAYSNQQRARHQRAATSHRAREPSSKDSRTKTKKRSCRSANSNSEDEAKNHEQAAQRRRGTSPEANAEDLSDWSQSTVAVVIDATKARWNKSNQKKTRRVSPEKSANSEHEPPPEDQRRTDSKKQPRCVATPEPQRPSTWSDPLSERHNKSETARVPGNVPNKTVSDSRPSYTYLTSNPDRPANGWRGQHSVPRPQTAQKGPEPVRPSGLEPLRERAGARTVNPADEHQQHKEGGRGVHDASAKSVTRSLGLESDGSDAAPAGARSSSLTRLMRACDRGMLSEDEHDERSERRLRAGSSKRRRTRKDTLEQHAYARHDGLVDEQDDPLDLLVYAQPGASDSSRLRNAPHPYRSRLQDRFTTPPPDTYDSPPRRNAFDHTFDDPISPDPLELVDFGHGASHRTREVAQVAQRAEEDDSHDLCDCEECQHVHGWQDGGGEPEWSARAAAKYTEYTERGEEVEQAPYGGGLPSVPYPVHDPVGHGRERMCDDPDGHEPCRWPVSESVWAEAHTEEAANALFTNPVYRRNGNKGSGGEDKAAFVERLVRMDGAKADTNSWDWNEARFGAHGEERFWRPFRR